jgi:hypothetical protein
MLLRQQRNLVADYLALPPVEKLSEAGNQSTTDFLFSNLTNLFSMLQTGAIVKQ